MQFFTLGMKQKRRCLVSSKRRCLKRFCLTAGLVVGGSVYCSPSRPYLRQYFSTCFCCHCMCTRVHMYVCMYVCMYVHKKGIATGIKTVGGTSALDVRYTIKIKKQGYYTLINFCILYCNNVNLCNVCRLWENNNI